MTDSLQVVYGPPPKDIENIDCMIEEPEDEGPKDWEQQPPKPKKKRGGK